MRILVSNLEIRRVKRPSFSRDVNPFQTDIVEYRSFIRRLRSLLLDTPIQDAVGIGVEGDTSSQ
jgi:hypothetical protein